MNFYVLYGPSGTGKTTLCRFLSNYNFLYLDIGSHPDFRKKSMVSIALEIAFSSLKIKNNYIHIITEGVFSKLKTRINFINSFINNLTVGFSFDKIYTIYIMMLIHYVRGEIDL